MSERWLAIMVGCAWLGAVAGRWAETPSLLLTRPVAVIGLGATLMALALRTRRPGVLVVAIAVLALGRAVHTERTYVPAPSGTYVGWVRLVTDPEPGRFGTNAEGAIDGGQRVQLSAGWDVPRFDSLAAGEAVFVDGHVRSIDQTDWARSRHLSGRLTIDRIEAVTGVRWWGRPSQWLRGAVQAGADRLPRRWQALYTGLVIGDDRFQSKGQQARFRAAGLSHLLAVSGQNVAFVLAVANPLIGRLGWWSRWLATVGVLLVFALATRLEPSVLRATATALASVWAMTSGARASGVRALAIAVTALVIIDPFLVWSVGFRLSLAASAGILVVGPVIEQRLPGAAGAKGEWWRTPLAVTVGAQAGVTPLLVGSFGPVALVSVPANLLAGWTAGLVMTWGLTGGLVAAVVAATLGEVVGAVVQWPALAAMWWIDRVASLALRVPSPMIGGGLSLLAMLAGFVAWLVGETTTVGRWVWSAVAVLLFASTVPRSPVGPVDLDGGGRFWPDQLQSVLVVSANADDRLVDAVVERRIVSIDVVVVEAGGRTMSGLVTELRDVATIGVVFAPSLHRVVGGRRLLSPMVLSAGGETLFVRSVSDDRLEVETGLAS